MTDTFTKFLKSVDIELGRDSDSLNIFEWVIEDRYEEAIYKNLDYFAGRPDLLHIQNEQIMFELGKMLEYFELIEEYEKCASLVKVKEELTRTINGY